jgi:zinc protease
LTLLTKQDKKLPFVEIRLVMKSGLLFEEASNNGIAPLTSKLLLKGTKNRKAEEIVNQLESVGGSISPYSGVNSMGVAIEVMNSDTTLALDILNDIVQNSSFDESWIKREKQAQIAEIRQEREQPVKIALQSARAQLFGAHPYSLPNLGTEKTVSSLSQKQLRDFWKRVAVPSNMVISIFGNVTNEEATKLVERSIGSVKGEPVSSPKTPPPNFGKANRVVNDQDKEQGVVVIGFPGIDIKNPDRASISIMNSALSGMGSRLFLRLRDQLALCYYVGVNEMIGLDPGFIYFYIGTEPAKLVEAEKEIISEIEKLKKDGITPEELDRAKQGLMGERKMQKQNLGELALAAALDELYGLGYDYSDKLDAEYQKATAQQVHEAAKRYLSQPSVISIVKPKSEK